jgi:hypothetical protein
MKKNRRPCRVIILATALAVVAAGGAALVLANSAGAATPARATAAQTHSPHVPQKRNPRIVPMAPISIHASVSEHSTAAAPAVPIPARIQAVQLPAKQLPAAAAEKWVPVGQPNTRSVVGHDIRENECVSVHGATTWIQQGFSGDGGQTAAIQDTFAFASSAQAQAAYQAMATGMAHCQAATRAYQRANHTPPNAVVRQTASLAHAIAWERTWTGVLGISAAGPQANHLYLAVGGPVLIVLQFTEFPGQAAPYHVVGDPQVLAMLGTELAR